MTSQFNIAGLTQTQTFDTENRLTSVLVSGQTTTFVYDPDGNLVKKIKSDGSKTIYMGGLYEVDKTSGGTVTQTRTYYPAAGAMRIGSTLYYTLKDQLGSASVVTDASGATITNGEQRYYPYGESRLTPSITTTDKLFTGQRDTGLGIYDYGARMYNPILGRFTSADSIVPGGVQGLDRYAYTNNNPLNYTDPTGHTAACESGDGGQCSKEKGFSKEETLKYKIEKQFSNVKIGTGSFKLAELQEIYDTMNLLRDTFGGQDNFYNAVGNLTFNLVDRNQFKNPDDVAESVWQTGVINLSHDALGTSLGTGWYVLHEVGHRFDYINSGGDPSKYKSDSFVNVFMGGNCTLTYYGCESYNPSDTDTSDYGMTNSVEDFAEAFAVTVMYSGPHNPVTSATRITIIQSYIDAYSGRDFPR